MNERIDLLALDALDSKGGLDRHKFAELIVLECLSECWYDSTPKQIADNIRKKFGVE